MPNNNEFNNINISSNINKNNKPITKEAKQIMLLSLVFVIIISLIELIPVIYYSIAKNSATLGSGQDVWEVINTLNNINRIISIISVIAIIAISISNFMKNKKEENKEANIPVYIIYIIIGAFNFIDKTGLVPIAYVALTTFYAYKFKNNNKTNNTQNKEDNFLFMASVVTIVIFLVTRIILFINNF